MMTLLLLAVVLTVLRCGFWGAAMGMAGAAYGAHQDKQMANKMKDAKKLAIQKQIAMWKKAYSKSQGQFNAQRQGILDREQQNYGGLTAGLASGGLLNTTVAPNMARGVKSDTDRSLTGLASARSATEYGQWMDLGAIKSGWGDIYGGGAAGGSAEGWGQAGAEFGGMIDDKGGLAKMMGF